MEQVSLPSLEPNQVLVHTHQAPVCGSERYFCRGINVRPEDQARGEPVFERGVFRDARGARPRLPDGSLGP